MKERMMIQMDMTVLCYKKCSTCQKALKWLDANGIKYEERPIKEEHPSQEELREWYKKSGRFTSMPSVARRASCCSSSIWGSLSFSDISL